MAEFSTIAEVRACLRATRDAIERLPVAAALDTGVALSPLFHLEGAVGAISLVEPAQAKGTHVYRKVHGCQPIEEDKK